MKILQLNFERGWRGGERQTLLCMQQLRLHGHDVALLARKDGELAKRARADGFHVATFSGPLAALCHLAIAGKRYDILHAQTANTLTWLSLLKPLLGHRIVFTRRTAFPLPTARIRRTRWKWQQVDAFVAISHAAADEPRRLGFAPVVIPSAISARPLNEDHLRQFAATFVPPGKRVLATVAALTPEKDPLTLIQAVDRLRRLRDDFIFLHIGGGGSSEDDARAQVASLGLEAHYVFTGFQSGIEDLYRLMDVYVSSSRHEALGTSVLDAFLYSVPVVSTRAGGLTESLADGRGLLCDVGDAQAMAQAMDSLLRDSALRAQLIERAGAYVRREHDVTVMGRRYLALYDTVVSRREPD